MELIDKNFMINHQIPECEDEMWTTCVQALYDEVVYKLNNGGGYLKFLPVYRKEMINVLSNPHKDGSYFDLEDLIAIAVTEKLEKQADEDIIFIKQVFNRALYWSLKSWLTDSKIYLDAPNDVVEDILDNYLEYDIHSSCADIFNKFKNYFLNKLLEVI